jgi:hypothetical protein
MKSTSVRKNGHPRYIFFRSSSPSLLSPVNEESAVPAPYQEESRKRFWVQAKTQGIARKLSTSGFSTLLAGRLPIFTRESSPIGEAPEKKDRKSSSLNTRLR